MPKLTIKDAAERLGISEVTVRRRLKKGELIGEQVPTAQGYTWFVQLADADETVTTHDNGHAAATVDHVLVRELRGQVNYLKRELIERKAEHDRDWDCWREELQRVHTLMAQHGQTVQALTQRIESLPASVATNGTDNATGTEPLPRTIPVAAEDRWHRWVGTFAGLATIGAVIGTLIQASRGGWNPSRDILIYALTVLNWGFLYGELWAMQKKNRAADDGDRIRRDYYATWQDRFGAVTFVAFLAVLGVLFFV